jgi:hypothetical protein
MRLGAKDATDIVLNGVGHFPAEGSQCSSGMVGLSMLMRALRP